MSNQVLNNTPYFRYAAVGTFLFAGASILCQSVWPFLLKGELGFYASPSFTILGATTILNGKVGCIIVIVSAVLLGLASWVAAYGLWRGTSLGLRLALVLIVLGMIFELIGKQDWYALYVKTLEVSYAPTDTVHEGMPFNGIPITNTIQHAYTFDFLKVLVAALFFDLIRIARSPRDT